MHNSIASCHTPQTKLNKQDTSGLHSTNTRSVHCAVGKKWIWSGFWFTSAKNCGFWFSFGFKKLTVVSFFSAWFTYNASNYVLPCWIGPTNCQQKYSDPEMQTQHKEKYTLTVDHIMLEVEMWMIHRETAEISFFENWTAEVMFWAYEFWGQFAF